MLKKIKILCLLLFIFALAGCEVKESDKKDRDGMFKVLKEEGIIADDFKLIDDETECGWVGESCWCGYSHIYEDSNSNLIKIKYTLGEKKNSKYYVCDHYITIEYDLVKNNDYQKYDEEPDCGPTYYIYPNGDITDNSKYASTTRNRKYYKAYEETKYLFFKDYRIVEDEVDY